MLFVGAIAEAEVARMPVGAYYYPEQWDSEQWERDLSRMAELGFDFTHFAEFAWSTLEPSDSVFNFEWLDRAVGIADENGLKIVMCTPSATPPAWLTEKHPEIMVVSETGKEIRHGMRLNCNPSNPVYQHYIERIIKLMAERYGNHPAVIGWQIDNEPHFEGLYDYSDFAESSFKEWLRQKYGDIDSLNKSWGGPFWSLAYNDFDQIQIPNKEFHFSNPHAFIDFERYNADALAEGLAFQYDLLRSLISQNQWVTTNFAYYGFLPSVDPFRSRDKLDFASYTMYPMNTYLEYPEGPMGHRLGSGMELAFQTEIIRSVAGKTGVMELQPGQINWGAWNSQPLPGAVRMWIWHCYGLGDEFACTYRFRQPLYGPEQFHKGIMEPNGVTLSPGGKEFVRTIEEMKLLPPKTDYVPADIASRRTAFLWKHDNLFSSRHTQVREDWNLWAPYLGYYKKLKSIGAGVDFITETDSFDVDVNPFMVMVAYEMADTVLTLKLRKYVEEGGNLIITFRSGMKDNDSHLWEGPQQEIISELAGIKIKGFDQLPAHDKAQIRFEDENYDWYAWGDLLEPQDGTEVWAVYADQFYKGTPCVTFRKLGKGSVCYIGAMTPDFSLEEDVIRKFYTLRGAEILDLPDYFFVEYRDGCNIAVNYTSEGVDIPARGNTRLIIGEYTVMPGEVTVWKDTKE